MATDKKKARNIRREIREKLANDVLRDALGRFAEAYPTSREKAFANVPDVAALRAQLRDVKQAAVTDIDAIADTFVAEATKRGSTVFRAHDGDAITAYLLQLCREKHVKRIVKSKSMATEEIQLNRALEAAGMHVKETDLGEWIIALAGQRPSHMVLPAIHLNRRQVADYMTTELGHDVDPDIPSMVQQARATLREEFLQADLGITGANFGVAENGAIGLFTNEGNGRLVSTLPPIHVVIIGYEKLVRTLRDAVPIMRLLPRSATGQLMTSYLTMLAGSIPTLVERDGRWVEEQKELHIILLDGGRKQIAQDETFQQVYQCVRCGSCLNVCPVYTLVGGHVYGHIYTGGIGAILTAFLHGMHDFSQFSGLCTGCRRCTEVCPGMIDIPQLIAALRAKMVSEHGLPLPTRAFFEQVISNRKVFHTLLRCASLAQKPFQSGALIRHLPLFLANFTKERSLPAIAAVPLRDRLAKRMTPPAPPSTRVAFFSGCTFDFVYPETGESVVTVLQHLGMTVSFPLAQGCCGKPVAGLGDQATAVVMAKHNIEVFERENADVLLCACPTCTETWLDYAHLLAAEPEWAARARALAGRVREFCGFVAEAYAQRGMLDATPGATKVTYHDSCHLNRGLHVTAQPRQLLAAADGYALVEMRDCAKCCGMAGAFGMTYADLARPILAQKIQHIKDTGADIVAVACPACMMQLRGGLDQQAPEIQVKHVADLLAESIRTGGE
ncbi:MAG TPA: LUD domain-containing protein [Armatimonadota bacterium]|jgi:iron-sulfur cluster protein